MTIDQAGTYSFARSNVQPLGYGAMSTRRLRRVRRAARP